MPHSDRTGPAGARAAGKRRPEPSAEEAASLKRYWRSNLRIMSVLLLVWASVGLGCGVLFADKLNTFRLGGYSLGFWFAQQGSMYVFVILIAIYVWYMNRLDRRLHEHSQEENKESGES